METDEQRGALPCPNAAIRIGGFSGYLGNGFTGVAEVLAGDPVDVLIGDYHRGDHPRRAVGGGALPARPAHG
ncbi:hypothetical protein GCM10020366_72020 [Saccharopolyspora gregorii]|uniref:Uncharacterized protein n=1 Tax=Saccharopolyspora gregorii TaxID=33914 RepID=A0ABP6S3D8_9PSEU